MAMMDDAHELHTVAEIPGVRVTSYASELGSSSNHANRRLDESFTVELVYHHFRNSDDEEEESRRFALEKESKLEDIQKATMDELDELDVDGSAYYSAVHVVAKSCEILLQQVKDFGRKSLAMLVEIIVVDDQELEAEGEGDHMEAEEMYDEDDEMVVTEEDEKMAKIALVKECIWRHGAGFVRTERVVDDDMGCCAICLEEFEKLVEVEVVPCSHVFHGDCLASWILADKVSCPLCRTQLLPMDFWMSD